MFLRLISSVVVVACTASHAFAAERASFILTDGERKSGTVVFHGDQHENLINGYLNLGVDGGKDMTFPVEHVAVIDFVGGQPPATELSQLATGHMLVMRDGSTQQGRLINLTGGDTLFWENGSGQRQQFGIRDVSRVYLNPQSAKTVFGYTPPAAAPVSDQREGAIRVEAREGWTDSGLTVREGDRLLIEFAPPVRGLLGRVDNGAPFVIGAQPNVMRKAGRLMLSVSDTDRTGNRGPFPVFVTRQ